MTSLEEQTEIFTNRRERSCSTTSIISVSSETTREPKPYATMDIVSLTRAAANIDIAAFDRTRLFNPRKQRSCHKRAEPVSEEHRKKESSKNSREYTKRNRDEISTCRALLNDINAIKKRFKELIDDFKWDVVEMKIRSFVHDFETILKKYVNVGSNIREKFGLPEIEGFLMVYREKAEQVLQYEERSNSPNQHTVRLAELQAQLHRLTNDKDTLNSSKDKTNFASSKSRLNQRIVRENLKSQCWDCWTIVNTLISQAEQLQYHFNVLKKQIWNELLAVYFFQFGLVYQHRTQLDIQLIERIVHYFTPFSRMKGRVSTKWIPDIIPEPEVVTLGSDDEEMMEVDIKPQLPASSSSLPSTAKPDRMSPVERPKSMDMSRILNPQLRDKLLIQDRLISTTQFTPPALGSPSFTLALPTVPATSIPIQQLQMLHPSIAKTVPLQLAAPPLRSPVETRVKIERVEVSKKGDSQLSHRRSILPTLSDEIQNTTVTNEPKMEIVEEVEVKAEVKAEPHNSFLTNFLNQSTPPTSIPYPMIPPINTLPMHINPMQLPYNPLLAAPPGEITPFEALTPSFMRAIEQQQIMAAFLNNAFQKCHK